MKTIKELRNSININNLKSDELLKSLDNNQLMYIGLRTELEMLIEGVCTCSSFSNGNIKNLESYNVFTFNNEGLLNTLRQLYSNTKNNFVKQLVKTVGINKKMTERQLEIIIDEMMKFNLTINF